MTVDAELCMTKFRMEYWQVIEGVNRGNKMVYKMEVAYSITR